MQPYNRYLYEVDTVINHFIIIRALAYFCIESMASYMAAIVRAIYSYLVKTHLMTISLNVCSFLPLILISKQSIINWFNFCRDICTGFMFRHPVPLGGGGANDTVEVDEALYKRKNKYHRGHDRGGGKWLFGAIERITNKVILKKLFINFYNGGKTKPPPNNSPQL